MSTPKPDYGIDAPGVVRKLAIAGIGCIIVGFVLNVSMVPSQPGLGTILSIAGFISGFCTLFMAGLMVWSSKVGKLRQREHLIDSLGLIGNEQVLDVGCGRGLLLNGVARRLPNGKVFGVDLWQTIDQSGNSPDATLANSKIENVAGRIEIRTADMRDLPFPDGAMDVVISSLAIHNVPNREGRVYAIREMARVLKPKGTLAVQDLHFTGEYVNTLKDLGWRDVKLSGRMFMIFPPIRVVMGRKPSN